MYFSRSHLIIGIISFVLGLGSLALIFLGVYQWNVTVSFMDNLSTILSFGYSTFLAKSNDPFCIVFLVVSLVILAGYLLFTTYYFFLGLKRRMGVKILFFFFMSLISFALLEVSIYFGLFNLVYNYNKYVSNETMNISVFGLCGVGLGLIATVFFFMYLGEYSRAINRVQSVVNSNIEYEQTNKDELRTALAENKYSKLVIQTARRNKYKDMTPEQRKEALKQDRELDRKMLELEREEQRKLEEEYQQRQDQLAREKVDEELQIKKSTAKKDRLKEKLRASIKEPEKPTETSANPADVPLLAQQAQPEGETASDSILIAPATAENAEAPVAEANEAPAPEVAPEPVPANDGVTLGDILSSAESVDGKTSPSGTPTSEMPTEQIISNGVTPPVDSAPVSNEGVSVNG